MDQVVVAICGLGTKFVESIRNSLQSRHGVVIALVERRGDRYEEYLERLAKRVVELVERHSTSDNQVLCMLVSASEPRLHQIELSVLCPALRCVTTDPSIQLSRQAGIDLAERVHKIITDWKSSPLRRALRPTHDAVALLPVRNCGIRQVAGWLHRLCQFERAELPRSIGKKISRAAGGEGLVIHRVKFTGKVNSEIHPVRRCTDMSSCDLKARVRIGHVIPVRYEFDVTCPSGLTRKRFYLCDGARASVPERATHLNMRINDDFKW